MYAFTDVNAMQDILVKKMREFCWHLYNNEEQWEKEEAEEFGWELG